MPLGLNWNQENIIFNLIGLEKINKGERQSKNYGYLFEFTKDENAKNDNFNKCDNDKYIFDIIQYNKE
jgi:hypothetical protein